MVRRAASPFSFVASGDVRQVQLVHHVGDEVGQMIVRQPLLQGRGQQQLLVRIVGKVGLAHRRLHWFDARPIIPSTPRQPLFSDGLLGTRRFPSAPGNEFSPGPARSKQYSCSVLLVCGRPTSAVSMPDVIPQPHRVFRLSLNVIASAAWQSRSHIDQRCRQLTLDHYVPIIERPWQPQRLDGHHEASLAMMNTPQTPG